MYKSVHDRNYTIHRCTVRNDKSSRLHYLPKVFGQFLKVVVVVVVIIKNTAYLGISFHIISNNVVEMETLLTSHNSSEM